jgi:DNA-binding CsgD family transcriptional regulator
MLHDDYNRLLLSLYRQSHELPLEQFQDGALAVLKSALPFDSAMWGMGTLSPEGLDVHSIHLHHQPPEMLASYAAFKDQDTAALEVAKRTTAVLSFDTQQWFSGKSQGELREHGRRFEQAHFFIGGTVNPDTCFARWLTLFRADPRARGEEPERLLLAHLMPHVHQALELNRLQHLRHLPPTPDRAAQAPIQGQAMADPRGTIYHMDTAFSEALRTEWSHWHGPQLPQALLLAAQRGERRWVGRSMVATLHSQHALLWLRTRRRSNVDTLGPRERLVAELIAQGLTHKEVAHQLQRSPATVRSQVQVIYLKLGIHSVTQLVEALRQAG